MSNDFQIIERKPDHAFRTEIPNIIWELGLTPYERDLYSYFKKVAGDHGQCYQTRKRIKDATGISPSKQKEIIAKLRQPFELLGGKTLIKVFESRNEKGEPNPTQILITDIWRENGDHMREKYGQVVAGGAPGAGGGTPPHGGGAPGAGGNNKIPFNKNPSKKVSVAAEPPRQVAESPKPKSNASAITIKTPKGDLNLSHDDLFPKALRCNKNYTTGELTYAWNTLAQYSDVVYDWWKFIEGTIANYKMSLKSKQAAKKTKIEAPVEECEVKTPIPGPERKNAQQIMDELIAKRRAQDVKKPR